MPLFVLVSSAQSEVFPEILKRRRAVSARFVPDEFTPG
jgi:hypothetical protein